MPCHDAGRAEEEAAKQQKHVRFLEAALCACVRGLGVSAVGMLLDAHESGVAPAELLKWWEEHEGKDTDRRLMERYASERQAARRSALAKLSPVEKRALGLREDE